MQNKRVSSSIKGFTLIEMVVATFIFTVIALAGSQVLARTFQSYREVRALQRDAENAQYILTSMAKQLRTSTVVPIVVGVPAEQFLEHSQGRCYQYRIEGGALKVAYDDIANDVPSCSAKNFIANDFRVISTGTVNGNFDVVTSRPAPPRVGKVTISLDVSEGTRHIFIQTSASFRDYGYSGL